MSIAGDIVEEFYYNRMRKYIDRLVAEWRQHENIIIGVDYDDTIYPYREGFTNIQDVIDTLKEAHKHGAVLVIFTASKEERYPEIEEYCKGVGLEIAGINTSIISPFGDNRKIYANIYLDDRSGLNESLEILKAAIYSIKGDQNTKSTLQQAF